MGAKESEAIGRRGLSDLRFERVWPSRAVNPERDAQLDFEEDGWRFEFDAIDGPTVHGGGGIEATRQDGAVGGMAEQVAEASRVFGIGRARVEQDGTVGQEHWILCIEEAN
ncbi:MAG: hypothetical protein HY907_16645 [Deltaproteobacteria bacterium]|nr:hypothetical protein [Deltaproteobacteria bacterium]